MTKAEERKILEQIVELIQSTPTDSYIRSAFSGVPEYAVRNIDDDAAYNPVEERDMWEKRYNDLSAEMGKKLLKLEHENQALQTHIDEATEELTMWENRYSDMCGIADRNAESAEEWEQNAHEAGDLYCELEKECAKKDMEIMRLKAEIYDLRKECGK